MVVSYQDIKYREIHDGCHIAVIVLAVMAASAGTETGLLSRLAGALCVSAPMLVAALIIPGAFGGGDINCVGGACGFCGGGVWGPPDCKKKGVQRAALCVWSLFVRRYGGGGAVGRKVVADVVWMVKYLLLSF